MNPRPYAEASTRGHLPAVGRQHQGELSGSGGGESLPGACSQGPRWAQREEARECWVTGQLRQERSWASACEQRRESALGAPEQPEKRVLSLGACLSQPNTDSTTGCKRRRGARGRGRDRDGPAPSLRWAVSELLKPHHAHIGLFAGWRDLLYYLIPDPLMFLLRIRLVCNVINENGIKNTNYRKVGNVCLHLKKKKPWPVRLSWSECCPIN